MSEIKLNSILHLTDEQIENSKIGLNMQWDGKLFFERWYESDENDRDAEFTYTSHYGSKSKVRNFTKIGQWCFGFVRLKENADTWLLISAGEITKIPEGEGREPCDHKELPQFQGLIGRLIIRVHKGNTFSRYIFNMSSYIEKAVVAEILPNVYEPIKFNGFENVHLPFKTLRYIIDGRKYNDYRAALQGVKGIYCLTDIKEGKCYIGSAYGENGILQRWSNYIDTSTGGNQALIELFESVGESYFEKNFDPLIFLCFLCVYKQ